MPINIPCTQGSAEQTLRIELDGAAYQLRIYYVDNDEAMDATLGATGGRWFMDFVGDAFAMYGVALVGGCDLLEIYAHPELGSLWVVDQDGKSQDPDFTGFGGRWQLRYYQVAEADDFLRSIDYV